MKKLIITHKNCMDGKCSKTVLKNFYNGSGHYIELDHANLHDEMDINAQNYIDEIFSFSNTEVIMADFCLPMEIIDGLLKKNNRIIILDHHETTLPIIEHYEKRILSGEKLNMEINFCKENERSGAWLSWEYLHPNKKIPELVKYVSDGDIWKFNFGIQTKYFYTGFLHKYNDAGECPDEVWDRLLFNEKEVFEIIDIGRPIYEDFIKEVMAFLPKAEKVVLDGSVGLMVEANRKYTSDLGNLLAKKSGTFGMVYQKEKNMIKCSLRSVEPFSVRKIAEKFGGGGHGQASAFRCKDEEDFKKLLKNERELFEN